MSLFFPRHHVHLDVSLWPASVIFIITDPPPPHRLSLCTTLVQRGFLGTSMAGEKGHRSTMDIKRLGGLLQRRAGRLLVIDSRTFSEYNALHVHGAVNVCCSKLVKRRLQQDKVSVTELLQPNGKVKVSSQVCFWESVLLVYVIQKLGNYRWHQKRGWCLYANSCKPLKGSVNNADSFVWTSQPCHCTVL